MKFGIFCFLLLSQLQAIRITSSGPKVIYKTHVQLDHSRGGDIEIFAFEEPADVVARFARDKGLTETSRKELVTNVCETLNCRRDYGDILIMNTPLSWFSELNNEYCSVVIRMGESDLQNMTNYINHHCKVLEEAYASCICTDAIITHLFTQIEQNAAAFVWSEYSSPHTRLGVAKDSTEREIKKAYRSLSKKLHPDTLKKEGIESEEGYNQKFLLLTDAYEKMIEQLSEKQVNAQTNHDIQDLSDETVSVSFAGFTIRMNTGFKATRDASGNIHFQQV